MLSEQDLEALERDFVSLQTIVKNAPQNVKDILENQQNLVRAYKNLRLRVQNANYGAAVGRQFSAAVAKNHFVLVLVDGYECIVWLYTRDSSEDTHSAQFQNRFLAAGSGGGATAAQWLEHHINTRLRRRNLQQSRIIVKIYMDLHDLSEKLARLGLTANQERSLASFTASFTRENKTFEVVDTSGGRRMVGEKIRGTKVDAV